MSEISIENETPETTSFKDLRGVQWRIDLGILPSCPSTTIDDLRRVTANSRRRYAALRRQLLVDPHVPKDGSSSPDLLIDNPLSQNPDSIWGRFFRNAELEKMVDQDLTRLYPERGSYFQTTGCQGMLRRILLLWCLRHPDCGYRQGMHELLAPLLYVLHVDMERLSEVRKLHDDHFADKFDGFSFHENDLTFKFDFKKFDEDVNGFEKCFGKATNLSDLDPEIQTIVLLSDAYGAEGELGVVLSEKFMEHDLYSMFDALMSGAGGAIAMAEFFSHHSTNSQTGFPPVIEASSSLYHLLSIVDSSLHSHLVELGVEPQYFALRWLRVLFGREFSLENLLVIWDEIFAHENKKVESDTGNDSESTFGILESPRGAFISSFAVSMILNLRSSLLATETATSCLQRLLNFPDDVNLVKLIEKAKSLQNLAAEAKKLNSLPPISGGKKPVNRGHSLSLDFSNPPKSPPGTIPDSYWEEKWRVLHKEEQKQGVSEKNTSKQLKSWSERVKLRLSRTGSVPTPPKKDEHIPKPSVRRNLLKDLARQLESDEVEDELECDEDGDKEEGSEENGNDKIASEDVSYNSSNPLSPVHVYSDHDNESESSVASNSIVGENEYSVYSSPLPILPDDASSSKCSEIGDTKEKLGTGVKERKVLSGRFQWLWKLGKNVNNEGTSERRVVSEDETVNKGNGKNDVAAVSSEDRGESLSVTSKGETVDQNLMVSLRNLGQSMLENIQVIETVFQQEQRVQTESSSKSLGKKQVTAMSALKELRKISNLLSEM